MAKRGPKAKVRAKRAAKVARKKARRRYNPQTGRLTGREMKAQARRDDLIKKYQLEGMPLEAARQRAIDEMRDNPKRDWRRG